MSLVRFPLWPPAPYWLGQCQYNVIGGDRSHGIPALFRVWQHAKLSGVSLGTRLGYSLVVDEDVKKPNKPPKPDVTLDSQSSQSLISESPARTLGCVIVDILTLDSLYNDVNWQDPDFRKVTTERSDSHFQAKHFNMELIVLSFSESMYYCSSKNWGVLVSLQYS